EREAWPRATPDGLEQIYPACRVCKPLCVPVPIVKMERADSPGRRLRQMLQALGKIDGQTSIVFFG
ncbi:hypothetical protein, partial [Propionivibrio sp.]|uniref:hypothetical protein n=1 Tax=Propionivibrio sp. TaxID=2212460 RepID=UPI003BF14F26